MRFGIRARGGLAFAMVLIAGLAFTSCGSKKEAPAVAPTDGRNNTQIQVQGKIKAHATQNIALDFSPKLKKLPVKEGQIVKKGEVLAELDLGDFKEELRKGQLNLDAERVKLSKLELSYRDSNRADEDRLRNQLETAKKNLDRAKDDFSKEEVAYSALKISKEEFETYKRNLEDKQQAYQSAKQDLENVIQDNRDKQSAILKDIEISKLNIASMENELNLKKKRLEKEFLKDNLVLSTLESGLINIIKNKEGDTLQKDMSFMEIINQDTRYVEVEIPEEFLKDLKIGNTAQIISVADPSKKFQGTLSLISNVGKEKNGETIFIGEVTLQNPDEFLKVGFNVDVNLSKS